MITCGGVSILKNDEIFEEEIEQEVGGAVLNYDENQNQNARRFINAYNVIDQSLRSIYNFKRNLSFADVIRRTVPLNSVVRRYEDKLIDYGRLRNSIVHNSSEEQIIAEPHKEVVAEMEFIASLISSPPKVVEVIKKKDVKILNSNTSILDCLVALSSTGFKRIPIYDNNMLVGVVDSSQIVNVLGETSRQKKEIKSFLEETPIIDILETNDKEKMYVICSEELTVQEALDIFFNNRKIQVIIITKKGTFAERPINILTNADFIDLNKIIDDYNI